MMTMVKRRRGSVAHSRLYWRVAYFFSQNGGIDFHERDTGTPSVWCKQFLQRNGIVKTW